MPMDFREDWSQYQKLVLHELKRLNENIEHLTDTQKRIDKELEVIKVKSTFFGTLAAIIVVSVSAIVDWLKGS